MRQLLKHMAIALTALVTLSCVDSGKEDPSVPGKLDTPTGISVVEATRTSLSFVWNEVTGAEGYYTRLEDTAGNIVSGGQKSPKTAEVTYSGLQPGSTFRFKVKAVSAKAESGYSAPVTAATEKQPDDPDTPDTPDGPDDPDNPDNPDTPDNPDGPEDPDAPDPISDAAARYSALQIPVNEEDGAARAFPGAEGGGMYTTGGRGGRVIHVTNLNDSGEGSLRAAVQASGARTVVFDVAGIIELKSALRISNGDLTIAGQTAPGGGICLKNYTTYVGADNVIIRYVHFRLGDEGPNAGDGEDCIWGRYQKNIILDHCSMSWSIDECASFYGNRNMTMQWCIITESMNDSKHSKGAHGYGGIWGGSNASFHHNMLSNHHSRNPRIDHPEIYGEYIASNRGEVDLRNNLIYNWGDNSCYGGEGGAYNWVNCYYKPGPNSKDRKFFVQATAIYSGKTDYGYPLMYLSGNVHTKYADITSDNIAGIRWYDGDKSPQDGKVLQEPLPITGPDGQAVYTTTHSAEAAADMICRLGGASLRRDSVDDRAAEQVTANTGRIINTPVDVGGWPEYKAIDEELARVKDSDGDGMPDWFETMFCLDRTDASDGTGKTLDIHGRYTNLEMYLHYLVRDITAAQIIGGTYTRN